MDINKIFDTCDEFAGASLSDTMEAPTVQSVLLRGTQMTSTSIIGKLLMMLIWLIHHLCMFQLHL